MNALWSILSIMPRDSAHDIDVDQLLKAYTLGYFPMGRRRDDPATVWVLPEERGVLVLDEARAPKKLARLASRNAFDIRIDHDFPRVIAGCAEAKEGREETWINEPIEAAYRELFRLGYVHTVECWRDGALVGGLYGVALGGAFCGESMFSRATNASKIALFCLIERLKSRGFLMLDAQFYTDHLAQFGVAPMANADYQALLARALQVKVNFV